MQNPLPSNPMIKAVFDYYGECGRLAALYELQIRLLVAKTPALQHLMYEKMEKIETPFLTEFESRMSDDEKKYFSKSKKIRDKILHADFKGLIDKVKEVSPEAVSDANVGMLRISTGDTKLVGQTTKKDAGIFGWFLQAAQNGALMEAKNILERTNAIVDRISYETAVEGIE